MNTPSAQPDQEWVNVETGKRKHPYDMHKTVNRASIEVVSSESDDENHPKRWVWIRDGEQQIWVKANALDEYGYELQPEERVSEAELAAIQLKCDAIQADRLVGADPAVRFNEAYEALEEAINEDADNAVIEHLIIATYYAAKMDPDMDDSVDELRELVHEQTSHVDTSHPETLKQILNEKID